MTRDEFVDALILIEQKKKQIQQLCIERRAAEQALVIKYNIDQCNEERAGIQEHYDILIGDLNREISAIESQI